MKIIPLVSKCICALVVFSMCMAAAPTASASYVFRDEFDSIDYFRWLFPHGKATSRDGTLSVDPLYWRSHCVVFSRNQYVLNATATTPINIKFRIMFPGDFYRDIRFALQSDDCYLELDMGYTRHIRGDGGHRLEFRKLTAEGWLQVATTNAHSKVVPHDTWLELDLKIYPDRAIFYWNGVTGTMNADMTPLFNTPLTLVISGCDVYGYSGIKLDWINILAPSGSDALDIIRANPEAFYIKDPPISLFVKGFESADKVWLFYKFSSDGVNWGDWMVYGVDENRFDGWLWSFSPTDNGYYILTAYDSPVLPEREKRILFYDNFETATGGLPSNWVANVGSPTLVRIGNVNAIKIKGSNRALDRAVCAATRGFSFTEKILSLSLDFMLEGVWGKYGFNPTAVSMGFLSGNNVDIPPQHVAHLGIMGSRVAYPGEYQLSNNVWYKFDLEYNLITNVGSYFINKTRIGTRDTILLSPITNVFVSTKSEPDYTIYIKDVSVKGITRPEPMLTLMIGELAPVTTFDVDLINLSAPVEIPLTVYSILSVDSLHLYGKVDVWTLKESKPAPVSLWQYYPALIMNEITILAKDIAGNKPGLPAEGALFLLLDPDMIGPIVPTKQLTIPDAPLVLQRIGVDKYYAQNISAKITIKEATAETDNIGFGRDTWPTIMGKIINALYSLLGDNWKVVWDNIAPILGERAITGGATVNWYKELFNDRNRAVSAWKSLRAALTFWEDARFVDAPFGLDLSTANSTFFAVADDVTKLARAIDVFDALNRLGMYSNKPPLADELKDNLNALQEQFDNTKKGLLDNVSEWVRTANVCIDNIKTNYYDKAKNALTIAKNYTVDLIDNDLIYNVYARALFLLGKLEEIAGVVIGVPSQEDVLEEYKDFLLGRAWVIPAELLAKGENSLSVSEHKKDNVSSLMRTIIGNAATDWSAIDTRISYRPYAKLLENTLEDMRVSASLAKDSAEKSVESTQEYYSEEKEIWNEFIGPLKERISRAEDEGLNPYLLKVVKEFLYMAEAKASVAGLQ